ncbi:hypothetical protein MMYC01_200765 [Madurella mycetomatis]|uniref:Uncharacterized protein n=1 Tax=Madurella mycetomatis TaxID=100816 RepID=A0A175WGV8_9PEZI|nr:hypothetical protein MMYC01_200765 [Madurella mycetomatis]
MDTPIPISTRTGDVERRFSEILGELQSGSSALTTTVSADAVGDVRDKFRLWAGNIGARNDPASPFSLESRLVAASELLDQVADLLSDLADALDDLLEIIVGNHDNRTIKAVPGSYDLNSGQAEKDEAHDILDVTSECIRGLLRISILIRKATPRDRFSKALQATSNTTRPFLDQFDIGHVAERYPKLKREESRWLCERLGRAITKRRQLLRYLRDHRSRVAGGPGWSEDTEEEEVGESILAKNVFVVLGDAAGRSAHSAAVTRTGGTSEGAPTLPSTKASTLDVAKLGLLKIGEPEKEDTRSYVSASSSFHMAGSGDATLRLPTLAEVSKGEAMFECPFCFGIQTTSKDWEWRKHAFHDLRAYVCTFSGTECDTRFFGDSREWFDHEIRCHRRKWMCILCQKGPFASSQEMETHARREHGNVLAHDSQLQVILSASQQSPDALPAQDCPFCNEWAESLRADIPEGMPALEAVVTVDPAQFRRHVASHQEQLALFALPRRSGDECDVQELHGSLSRSLPSSSHRLDSVGDDGDPNRPWLLDPPLHIAVASGNLQEVERMLREGADPELKGETWGDIYSAALSVEPRPDQYLHKVQDLVRRLRSDTLYGQTEYREPTSDANVSDLTITGSRQNVDSGNETVGYGTSTSKLPSGPSREQPYRYSLEDELRYGPTDQPSLVLQGGDDSMLQRLVPDHARLAPFPYLDDGSGIPEPKDDNHPPWLRDRLQITTYGADDPYGYRSSSPPILQRYNLPEPLIDGDVEARGSNIGMRSSGTTRKSEPAGALSLTLDLDPPWRHPRMLGRNPDYTMSRHDRKRERDYRLPLSERERESSPPGHRDRDRRYREWGRGWDESPRVQIADDGTEPSTVRIAEVPAVRDRHEDKKKPIKGILKPPTSKFPEDPNPIREGVAPRNDDKSKSSAPSGARWTKITRKIVSPEALRVGNERFEVRDDFVIVFRVLSKEEIIAYAEATNSLRERRKKEASKKAVDDWVVGDTFETAPLSPDLPPDLPPSPPPAAPLV